MKRSLTQALGQEESGKKKRYLLNEKGDSWVDCFPLKPDLRPTKEQFDALWNTHPGEFGEVKIMGKPVKTPRWQQSYGQAYNFSGMLHDALPVPETVQPYLDWANSLTEDYLKPYGDKKFNMALLNWYQDGNHNIGYHSDDERQLVQNKNGDSIVFSISLGQQRELTLKPKKDSVGETVKVKMPNCSAVVMCGRCQKTHKHAVLKVAGEKGKKLGRRINLTFRIFSDVKK